MAKKRRYQLRDSDRSGFTFREIELVNDNGALVGPDEFDTPPPSNRLYPDEGGVSDGDTRSNYTSYAAINVRPTQIVNPSDQINLMFQKDNSNFQIKNPLTLFYVAGVSSQTVLTSNPQVPSSNHGDKICIECTSNNLVMRNGNGLRLYSNIINMNSGFLVNLIYNATDGLWCETSRGAEFGSILGEF